MFENTDLAIATAVQHLTSRYLEHVAPQPKVIDVDDEPKTIDGTHYRHQLIHGGWLIEVVSNEETLLIYETPSGERIRLVAAPV